MVLRIHKFYNIDPLVEKKILDCRIFFTSDKSREEFEPPFGRRHLSNGKSGVEFVSDAGCQVRDQAQAGVGARARASEPSLSKNKMMD